jgi:4-hydroxy-tetrahydrodipicolinate synthase
MRDDTKGRDMTVRLDDLGGIIASLHTPFTADDAPDHASLVRLIDHVAAAGCTGVLATAVAGEVGALTPDERHALLDTVTTACRGRLRVIAGVSAADLATSLDLARRARTAGADLVLWQPPEGMAHGGLADALARLGDAGPGPVMLQDLDWHGSGIPVPVIADCAAAVPAFQALKVETVPAGPKYTAVRAALGARLHLSGGWAAMHMLDGLARGLDAFIPSGLLPAYVRIFDLWQQGEHDTARALFERCLPIITFSNQDIRISIAFWKKVRRLQGLFATELARPPVGALDAVQAAEAERLADRAVAIDQSAG